MPRGDPIGPHRVLTCLCALLALASALPPGGALPNVPSWIPEPDGTVETVLLRFTGPAMLRVGAVGTFSGEFALDARMRAPVQGGEKIPLAGHEVHLVADGARTASALTDGDGRFSFVAGFDVPGTHTLRAEASVAGWSSMDLFVDAVEAPSRPVLSLERNGWDANRVTWTTAEEGGRPVTSATLTVRDAEGAVVWRTSHGATANGSALAWAARPGMYQAEVTVSNAVGASEPGVAPFEVLTPPPVDAVTRDTWVTWLSSTACCYQMPDGHNGTLASNAHPVRLYVQPSGNVTGGGAPLAGVAVHTYARWEKDGLSGEVWTRAVTDANGRYATSSERVTLPSPAPGACAWYATRMTLEYGTVLESREGGFTLCRDAS